MVIYGLVIHEFAVYKFVVYEIVVYLYIYIYIYVNEIRRNMMALSWSKGLKSYDDVYEGRKKNYDVLTK